MSNFIFLDPGELSDGHLWLELAEKIPANPIKNYVPSYEFKMHQDDTEDLVGRINLRIGDTKSLQLYGGHVGYEVNKRWRGNALAERSCRLVFTLARRHGCQTLWITCDPRNIASYKTCENAGGTYVDTVTIPEDHEMYAEGRRLSKRYRFDLDNLS